MKKAWFEVPMHDVKYASAFVVSVICSVLGVLYGAKYHCQDGGRGGAIAVAVAFSTLFLRIDFGRKAYETVAIEIPAAKQEIVELINSMFPQLISSEHATAIVRLNERLDGIYYAININSNGQTRQNWWLAAASIQGTLVWGFGDWIVSLYPDASYCLFMFLIEMKRG